MAQTLYADVPNTDNLININISESHSGQVSTAIVEAESTDLEIGNDITVDMGYEDDHAVMFTGYVKDISVKEPDRTYVLTCSDVLVRATEFYIVSSNPEAPMTRSNIDAGDLVRDVMNEAGIFDVDYDLTNFICGVNTPIEINLVTSYDYAKFLADLIAYNLWADRGGGINFFRRFPWVVDEDVPIGTITTSGILSLIYSTTDKDLRNKVVVYGSEGIYAERSEESPYLPEGFYKSIIVSAPQVIDTQEMADLSAEYNLELYNKLTYAIEMAVIGNHMYYPRQTITLDYPYIVGLSRDWYIFSTEHAWNSGGFITTMVLRNYG